MIPERIFFVSRGITVLSPAMILSGNLVFGVHVRMHFVEVCLSVEVVHASCVLAHCSKWWHCLCLCLYMTGVLVTRPTLFVYVNYVLRFDVEYIYGFVMLGGL